MSHLSVCIITQNEAERIRDCLRSVAWADEIIVLDSGSDDATLEICREYTDHVYVNRDWQGFGVQKNRALSYAGSDWILSLDADERIPPELREEIQAVMSSEESVDVYEIPRLSSYCGREIWHSGWRPDYVARLFRRDSAAFSDDVVHERLLFNIKPGRLTHSIQHRSFDSLEQVLDKVNRYSSASAEKLYSQNKKSTLSKAVFRGMWAFFRTYVLKAGFLDGREGFLLAVSNAEGVYYKYLKLLYLDKKR
ncbi:MAG: glycosyltransferase family 2 protein [Candidatus Thiodiazotropha sp. (ex Monitilora ramsayi)]|nr:glycosyltransferase family 2 protein [Candidatus Thiodiazotropha sp. (ex Monitilora ramsayi)]